MWHWLPYDLRSIVSRKPKIEALTKQITSVPTSACTGQLLRIYDVQLASTMHQSAILQRVLDSALGAKLRPGDRVTVGWNADDGVVTDVD